MKPIAEMLDTLETASQAVNARLESMEREGAEPTRIARERWRRRLIEETLKAVHETVQEN